MFWYTRRVAIFLALICMTYHDVFWCDVRVESIVVGRAADEDWMSKKGGHSEGEECAAMWVG
jgi:hypothetical protein